MRKLAALLLVLMMTAASALAEVNWPRLTTAGQEQLRAYVERVNGNLAALGQPGINSVFECYETFVTMGVTASDNAEIPESVEMTFLLNAEGMQTLELRVSDAGRFAAIAAACMQAISPAAVTLEAAMAEANRYLQWTLDAPETGFEDELNAMQGVSGRVYYAYFPNQYGMNWRQMTLVFPLPGSEDAPLIVPPEPGEAPDADLNEVYSMNTRTFEAGFEHYEFFPQPTAEPDSAANEW